MPISNHNSFRATFDKIASVHFSWKIYLYFSIGNGRPRKPTLCQLYRKPTLCQLYRHTFVPCVDTAASGRSRGYKKHAPNVRWRLDRWLLRNLSGQTERQTRWSQYSDPPSGWSNSETAKLHDKYTEECLQQHWRRDEPNRVAICKIRWKTMVKFTKRIPSMSGLTYYLLLKTPSIRTRKSRDKKTSYGRVAGVQNYVWHGAPQ